MLCNGDVCCGIYGSNAVGQANPYEILVDDGSFFVVTLLLMGASPVLAQMEPRATFPIANSTVTNDIELIRIEFSEPIDPTISGLELRRGDSQVWIAGVGARFCDTMSCQLYLGELEPDLYTVVYDVFTPSGDEIKNEFKFRISPAAATGN